MDWFSKAKMGLRHVQSATHRPHMPPLPLSLSLPPHPSSSSIFIARLASSSCSPSSAFQALRCLALLLWRSYYSYYKHILREVMPSSACFSVPSPRTWQPHCPSDNLKNRTNSGQLSCLDMEGSSTHWETRADSYKTINAERQHGVLNPESPRSRA